jgi:hypothetical protein
MKDECEIWNKRRPGGSLSTSDVCSSVAGGREIVGGVGVFFVAKKYSRLLALISG